jgi:hypothetical protein
MSTEPVCLACDQKRQLITVIPIVNRHEMRVFECARCKSVFRLVAEREADVLKDDLAFV